MPAEMRAWRRAQQLRAFPGRLARAPAESPLAIPGPSFSSKTTQPSKRPLCTGVRISESDGRRFAWEGILAEEITKCEAWATEHRFGAFRVGAGSGTRLKQGLFLLLSLKKKKRNDGVGRRRRARICATSEDGDVSHLGCSTLIKFLSILIYWYQ